MWVLHKGRGWHQADEYLILSLERYRHLFMDHLNQKPPLFLAKILYHGLPLPHDGATNDTSFISTPSSHDLTTYRHVNTSFDPAMGFVPGAPGHGVGRFNAGMFYLHGLNRRPQEGNENLIARLNLLETAKIENRPGDTGIGWKARWR